MKRITTMMTVLMLCLTIAAQEEYIKGTVIDADALEELRNSFAHSPENTALMNAVSGNDIKKLSKSRERAGKVNHLFSHVVETKGITNQKQSGRCWLYTGLNTLRPMVREKYRLEEFEFSQTYNFFWDQLEKANLFYEAVMATADKPMDDREVSWLFRNPVGDGGQWTTFSDNVIKYGLVPASAMPDTWQSEQTKMMSGLLRRKLREDGLQLRKVALTRMAEEAKKEIKMNMLAGIYRILVLCLGEPPATFTWQYKTEGGELSEPKKYTPLEFYDEIIGIDLNDYVMLMNDPSKAFDALYEVKYDRNLYEGINWRFINLPADRIKAFARASIIGNDPMYFSCDVGKQLDVESGTLDIYNFNYDDLLGVAFGMTKEQRIETFDSGSTHGMALVGVNILPDGSVDKWLLENSWGADKGNKGYLTMTDEWFDEYMFRLVVHRQYLDQQTLKLLEMEPVLLPPWDPIFAIEE